MTVNALNQITGRTVPGRLELLGSSPAATVTVNGTTATRQNDRYGIEVPVDNSTTARQVALNVEATNGASTTSKTVKRSLAAANQTYSYDLDGNLLSDGIWNYTWDAENRLIEAEYLLAVTDVEKRKLHYIYDHQSRRILRRELHWNTARNTWYAERQTKYIYDGWNCIAEILNESTLWKTHTWGLDLGSSDGYASTAGDGATTASGGGVQAFQTAGGVGGLLATEDLLNNYTAAPAYDGNGNLTALIAKGTDTLLAEYEYTAFGETLTAKGQHAQNNSYRFSTKPLDTDTGLYYYGYRYYDPTAGRWPSRDPIEEDGGINLYGFVGNDGVGEIDALGKYAYAVYRPFKDGWAKYIYPVVGHVFLSFDDEFKTAEEKKKWEEFMARFSSIRDPKLITMSFHPKSVHGQRYDDDDIPDNAGNLASILWTSGSYVWIDDPDDEEAHRNAGKFFGRGSRKKVAKKVCDQIKLFLIAFESAKKNLQGNPDPGTYNLYTNNCGTWAKTMVERAGLKYPLSARIFWNVGATYGGPADYTGLPQLITASAKRYTRLAQKLKAAQ